MADWKCVIGLHDWDEFGECRRDPLHVERRPHDFALYGGPYSRVMKQKHHAKVRMGEAFQAQMAVAGMEVSLELCKDVAWNHPEQMTVMLDIARERRIPPQPGSAGGEE